MNFADLIIVSLCVALVVFTIIYNLRRRKNAHCGSCCECRRKCETPPSSKSEQ